MPKYLADVQKDIVDNAENFREPKEGEQVTLFGMPLPQAQTAETALRRYRVNVLIDHSASNGTPVIYEDNPTYNNLVGRIEHVQQMGVLVGERLFYYLLHHFEPDFSELFKVVADFEETMESGLEANLVYAQLIGSIARKEGLRQFDRTGVARVIEHSSRLAGDADKLSIEMQKIADLLREADYWAGRSRFR